VIVPMDRTVSGNRQKSTVVVSLKAWFSLVESVIDFDVQLASPFKVKLSVVERSLGSASSPENNDLYGRAGKAA
jgi:hypothetical protein